MKIVTLIFGILLITNSCRKVERIDEYPAHKSKLVVNCIFNPDTAFVFKLSKSISPLDNAPFRDFTSPNGLVVVYENDVFFDSIRYNEMQRSFHGANTQKPKAGKTYKFEAFYPGYEKVSASGIVPEKFEISEYTINERKRDINYRKNISANISLKSQNPSSKYLIIKITARDTVRVGTGLPSRNQPFQFTPSTSIVTPGITYENIGLFLFVQSNISILSELELTSEIPYFNYIDDDVFEKLDLKYAFEISSCSKEVFEYKRRAILQNVNQNDPFAEPTPIFNNIENGFGIFGGENNSSFTLTK